MTAAVLTTTAHAKVNLNLDIVGKRANGYHELSSLFVFTDFGDTLTFYPWDNFALEVTGKFADKLAIDEQNSVVKAVKLLAAALDINPQIKIILTKNLPIGAGIGGGTSDAAAVLNGLLKIWNRQLPRQTLMDLALSIGADVPPSLDFQNVMVRGIGEILNTAPVLPHKIPLVLVNPCKKVPTKEIFMGRDNTFSPAFNFKTQYTSIKDLCLDLTKTKNDLMASAIKLCPEIREIFTGIQAEGSLFTQMSGSGATCFGIFATVEDAHLAAKNIKKTHQNWWVKETFIK